MSRIPVPSNRIPPSSPDISSSMSRNSPAPRRGESVLSGRGSELSDTRVRQSKRDEAIRKKIENELSRKRPGSRKQQHSSRSSRTKKSQAGTVSALRPLPALTVPQSISVADASQLCAAKRTDCVLVVDEDEHLCGIFTAKDLAFRVVGEGLDPRTTPVAQIMTKNPMVTRDTTSAAEALQTMVQRGFRHLPVCNEDGDVVGLLDITKVFHSSLEKLERAYGSSQQLYSALEGVQSEWSGANAALVAYVEQLRESMAAPDLGSLLDARTAAIMVGPKSSVRDAAKLMREHRTTAVIVVENPSAAINDEPPKIAGIFTSKDIVLRVIAAGLDSKTCSVVRVMTPHPDTAYPTTTIQEALRKMHDGHYLNLPIVDQEGQLAGCVDVLKLTYATLEQINTIGSSADGNGGDPTGGPMWSKFFNSFAGAGPEMPGADGGDGDTESIVSASDVHGTPHRFHSTHMPMDTPGSELAPGDSASVYDDESVIDARRRGGRAESSLAGGASAEIVDDGTYLFKFLAPGGTTHRFQARHSGDEVYDLVKEIVAGKLTSDPFFSNNDNNDMDPTDFKLSYLDDDGDLVLMSNDRDVEDAVRTAKKQSKDRVVLQLRGGRGWEHALNNVQAVRDTQKSLAAIVEDETEVAEEEVSKPTRMRHSPADDLVLGVMPKEYLLPSAIAFLGVAIIGVFALQKK